MCGQGLGSKDRAHFELGSRDGAFPRFFLYTASRGSYHRRRVGEPHHGPARLAFFFLVFSVSLLQVFSVRFSSGFFLRFFLDGSVSLKYTNFNVFQKIIFFQISTFFKFVHFSNFIHFSNLYIFLKFQHFFKFHFFRICIFFEFVHFSNLYIFLIYTFFEFKQF